MYYAWRLGQMVSTPWHGSCCGSGADREYSIDMYHAEGSGADGEYTVGMYHAGDLGQIGSTPTSCTCIMLGGLD